MALKEEQIIQNIRKKTKQKLSYERRHTDGVKLADRRGCKKKKRI